MSTRVNLGRVPAIGVGLVVVMLLVSAYGAVAIPNDAPVAIHWGVNGQADGYVAKWPALLLLPATGIVLLGIFLLVPRVEPRREHLARSAPAYRATTLAPLALLALLQVLLVAYAVGVRVDMLAAVSAGVGVVFIVIGNYVGKTQSMFLFGVRTPWTLSSERTWALTNRMTGRLLVLLGIAIEVVVLLGARGTLLASVLLGGVALVAVGSTVYSYLVWRTDPTRLQREEDEPR